jgi:Kef-type K+ transport system membrane component KefB
LGILSQTRAKGPLTDFSLAFIMASDVVIVTMVACALVVAKPLISGGELSLAEFGVLGHELLGSVATGTTLGLLLTMYLRFVGHNLPLVLLALGFGMTEFMRYVHVDPLLSFMSAGFVVQNLSDQGPKLLHEVEKIGSIVFVVFFATAGAHLDLPLLEQLWPIALTFFLVRALTVIGIGRYLSPKSDGPLLRRWGWSSMISQAGLTLGLSVVIARAFPEFGEAFRALAIATVALNEMIGPILFKMALDRSGESAHDEPMSRRISIAPDAH